MQRTGVASLPLHWGRAPRWLTVRMAKLARQVVTIVLDEYGMDDLLRRISDPFWFQALGCVLGYDWHSSGVTTVLTGVLKQAVVPEEHGIVVCGGKGRASRQVPVEIEEACDKLGLSSGDAKALSYASKMSAKVDSAAIQAGYQLYHHAFFVTEKRKWAVVQQGMCLQDRTARRYHWLSENVRDFVVEPHNAIVGDRRRDVALDMTAMDSEGCRRASVDIVKEPPEKTMHMIKPAGLLSQSSLEDWLPAGSETRERVFAVSSLCMPRSVNWKTLKRIYEFQPSSFEELLSFKGVGPATVRGLALIAELVYGEKPSWKDPVKYSFAYGGKDGVPYPVNRKSMDESIRMLERAIQEAKIGNKEKMLSLQRLGQFLPKNTRQ